MRSVEYSSGLPIASEWKPEPSAMTSPMSSCPQVRLLSALVKGSPGTKSDADVLAVDVLVASVYVEVTAAQACELVKLDVSICMAAHCRRCGYLDLDDGVVGVLYPGMKWAFINKLSFYRQWLTEEWVHLLPECRMPADTTARPSDFPSNGHQSCLPSCSRSAQIEVNSRGDCSGQR